MKTPDPSSEAFRAGVKAEPAPAEPGAHRSDERETEFEPRYLTIPQRRPRGHGRRNLVAGVALLLVSALLFGWALYLAGPGATYTVAVSLVTASALYVIARSRLLRQRNGVFLAGAIVSLVGVFLVLIQQAWAVATRPAAPVAQILATPAPVAAGPTPELLPLLVETFRPSPAELESGAVGKLLRNLKVEVEGKLYRLRAGDLLPVAGMSPREVRLAAGDQEVAVPAGAVDVTEPKGMLKSRLAEEPVRNAEPAGKESDQITARSHQEAMKKYPALAQKGSPENQSFVEAYKELKYAGGSSFFEDPEWPMRLANQLAAREGWGQPKGVPKLEAEALPEPTEDAPVTAPARQPDELPR